MAAADRSRTKQRGKPWPKGTSGNPDGRPPGSGPAAAVRRAIADDVPEIIARLAELAKGGDVQAARVLLDRVVPTLRAEAVAVTVPGLDAGSIAERAQAALEAAGRGEMSPDTSAALVGALASLARIKETTELEARIAALEAHREHE
jgi:hypothetical protein